MTTNIMLATALVLVHWFSRLRKKRRGGKLDDKWLGPYAVIAALGKGLFKLKEVNGDKVTLFYYSTIYLYMYVSVLCVLHALNQY